MKTPEGKLKDKVKAWLDSIGAYYFMPVQSGYGRTSLDFLVCYKGQFFAIETKAEGNEPTPRQQLVMTEIEKAGGAALWGDNLASIQRQFSLCDNG